MFRFTHVGGVDAIGAWVSIRVSHGLLFLP